MMITPLDILKYIPQRPPFVMIGELKSILDSGIESLFMISANNCLVRDGVFQESGLVENMAQTAAMYAGYKANEANEQAPIGYIGALKNLHIAELPLVNQKIITTIKLASEVMNIQIVAAEVRKETGELLAQCELRIFLKQD